VKFFGARASLFGVGCGPWFAVASLLLRPSLALRREPAVYEGRYGL
jgi:hypothetical protein